MARDPFVEEYQKGMAAVRKSRPKKRKLSLGKAAEKRDTLRDELSVEKYRQERNPQTQGTGTLAAGYDPMTDRAIRAIGSTLGNSALERNLRAVDENLIGGAAAEQAAFNVGRGEGTGWDALDLALAAPLAGALAKPAGLAARGVKAAARAVPGAERVAGMAARAGASRPAQYLREARPLVDNADDAIQTAFKVNVGMEPSAKIGGPQLTEDDILEALRAAGREPYNARTVASASEPTLVVDINKPLTERDLYRLSEQLRQDAIAQKTGDANGVLAGPAAADWGDFNPAFFYLQDGDTLGSSMLTDKFRAGAPREDLAALADKWGVQIDPTALSVNLGLRDEALAAGRQMPSDLGVFTSRPAQLSPEALAAYRSGNPVDFGGLQVPLMDKLPELSPVDARGVHISTQSGLSQLDPTYFGRGHQGQEYKAVKQLGLPKRSYFYSGPEGTILPEPAVMGVAGEKMVRGPRYAYEANLSGLYDIDQDPEKLWALAQAYGQPLEMERWVKDRGYAGYLTDQGPSWDRKSRRAAAVYGPTDVTPISNEPIDDWRRRFAVGGRV